MRKIATFLLIFFFVTLAYADEQARRVKTSTTNFDTNLSASDTTVQAALDTLDELSTGSGDAAWETDGNDDIMPVTGTISSNTYWETDGNDDLQPKN